MGITLPTWFMDLLKNLGPIGIALEALLMLILGGTATMAQMRQAEAYIGVMEPLFLAMGPMVSMQVDMVSEAISDAMARAAK